MLGSESTRALEYAAATGEQLGGEALAEARALSRPEWAEFLEAAAAAAARRRDGELTRLDRIAMEAVLDDDDWPETDEDLVALAGPEVSAMEPSYFKSYAVEAAIKYAKARAMVEASSREGGDRG